MYNFLSPGIILLITSCITADHHTIYQSSFALTMLLHSIVTACLCLGFRLPSLLILLLL